MTKPIAAGSPRVVHAHRFSRELRKAMAARKASTNRLAEATGVARSAIGMWKAGVNLPLPSTAARLAEVLDWPALSAIATDARRRDCERCGRSFVDLVGSGIRRFCSQECRAVDAQLRRPTPGAELYHAVRAATDARLAGAAENDTLRTTLDALRAWKRGDNRSRQRIDMAARRELGLVAAIEAMCHACEPEGLCRTPACPLRAYSPLPEASDRRTAELRKPDPWGPEHRDARLAACARRWSRPGERERQSEQTRARFAALTPEERVERGRRISAGIDPVKRSATSRAVHAAKRAAREELVS